MIAEDVLAQIKVVCAVFRAVRLGIGEQVLIGWLNGLCAVAVRWAGKSALDSWQNTS